MRREQRYDPMPPGGLCEELYPALRVLEGRWRPWFLEMCRRFYNGKIPQRFQDSARRYAAKREAWLAARDAEEAHGDDHPG